jgi:hypothetical protein
MTELAVLVPVLDRPHRVAPVLDAFLGTCDCEVIFIADPWDTPEIAAIEADGRGRLLIFEGNYAAKINAGVAQTDHPWVMLGADDLAPHPGWFEAAVAARAGVVGLNDLRPRDHDHATHFLMTRALAELPAVDGGPGPLHVGYEHNFPDRELIETAQHRGVYAYAKEAVVEHLHPLDGKAPHDATYAKGGQSFLRDRWLFVRRSHLWGA